MYTCIYVWRERERDRKIDRCLNIYIYIHTHTDTYVHTCIHPYIHTYIHLILRVYRLEAEGAGIVSSGHRKGWGAVAQSFPELAVI